MPIRTGKKSRIVELLLDLKDRLTGKVPQVTRSARKVDDELDKSAEGITRSGKKAETGTQGFVSSLNGLKLGALAVAAAFATLISRISAWAAASANQLRAETKLATTLRRTVGATEEQIQALKDQAAALQQTTGYGDEATISAQAMLATFQLSTGEIAKLTPVLLDTAEGLRKLGNDSIDLEQVAIAMGKAYSEGATALKRYGVTLTDTQEAQLKQANGMERAELLASILTQNFGGLAEAVGNTYEGAIRKADAASGDFSEVLGDLFTKNQDVTRLIDQWGRMWNSFGELVKDNSAEIGAVVSTLSRTISGALASVRSVFNVIQVSLKAVGISIGFTIAAIADGLGRLGQAAGRDFGDKFIDLAASIRLRTSEMAESVKTDFDDIVEAGRQLRAAIGLVGDESEKTKEKLENITPKEDPFAALGENARKLVTDLDAVVAKQEDLGDAVAKVAAGALKDQKTSVDDLSLAIGVLIERDAEAATAVREGLTKALEDLSAPELLQFQRDIGNALHDIGANAETTAAVFQSTLSAAFDKLGVDAQKLATGIAGEESDLIAAFATITENAQASAEQITAAFDAAREKITNPAALNALAEAFKEAFAAGLISVEQLNEGLDELQAKLADVTLAADPVEQAFQDLGVTSSAALKLAADQALRSFEIIRDSGTATAGDLRKAWEAYAEKAIESGDAIAQSTARTEAAALGLLDRYNELAGAGNALVDASAKTADNAEREAAARERSAVAATQTTSAILEQETRKASFDVEDLLAQSGGDPGAAATSLRRLFGTNTAGAAQAIDELYAFIAADRAQRTSPAQPSESIEVRLALPDGRAAVAHTGVEGANFLRDLAAQQAVSA